MVVLGGWGAVSYARGTSVNLILHRTRPQDVKHARFSTFNGRTFFVQRLQFANAQTRANHTLSLGGESQPLDAHHQRCQESPPAIELVPEASRHVPLPRPFGVNSHDRAQRASSRRRIAALYERRRRIAAGRVHRGADFEDGDGVSFVQRHPGDREPNSVTSGQLRHVYDDIYRGTSLIRKHHSVGPYSRHMPRALWWS